MSKFDIPNCWTVGVTYYTNLTPSKHFRWKKSLNSTPSPPPPQKKRGGGEMLSKVHKIGCAHLQCVKNHQAKFEYKGMKVLEFQITQTRHHLSIWSSTPKNEKKIFMKGTQMEGAHLQCVNNHIQSLNIKKWNFFVVTDYPSNKHAQ